MANDLEASAQYIDQELSALRERLLDTFQSNMEKYGIVATGHLKSFTKIDANTVADDLVGGLEIITEKYGIVLQSKRKFVTKAPIEDIIKWVKLIGLARFKATGKAPTEDAAIRKLAWGIKQHGRAKKIGADAIIKSNSARRRSDPWLYIDFFREVKTFQANLTAKIGEPMAKDISNAIRRQLVPR
jgi:hypothetical protein